MKNEALFSEKQKFSQWWMWGILVIADITILYGAFGQIFKGEPMGNNPLDDMGLLLTLFLVMGVNVLLFLFRLETEVYEEGIAVRYFPIHQKAREFSWDDISSAEVRTYSPLREYGGWGLRLSLFGNGKAWNVRGNQGLQLVFKNGKKLLIGTQKAHELEQVLEKLGK